MERDIFCVKGVVHTQRPPPSPPHTHSLRPWKAVFFLESLYNKANVFHFNSFKSGNNEFILSNKIILKSVLILGSLAISVEILVASKIFCSWFIISYSQILLIIFTSYCKITITSRCLNLNATPSGSFSIFLPGKYAVLQGCASSRYTIQRCMIHA